MIGLKRKQKSNDKKKTKESLTISTAGTNLKGPIFKAKMKPNGQITKIILGEEDPSEGLNWQF